MFITKEKEKEGGRGRKREGREEGIDWIFSFLFLLSPLPLFSGYGCLCSLRREKEKKRIAKGSPPSFSFFCLRCATVRTGSVLFPSAAKTLARDVGRRVPGFTPSILTLSSRFSRYKTPQSRTDWTYQCEGGQ